MKKIKWNKRKFVNNVKELLLGTSIIWLPIAGIAIANMICNYLGLGNIG